MTKGVVSVVLAGALVLVSVQLWRGGCSSGVNRFMAAGAGRPEDLKMTAYDAQIQALSEVDEALVLYRETLPPVSPGMEVLAAVAVDAADRIYAGGGRHLVVMTPQGEPLRQLTLDGDISCLAVDDQENIYAGLGNRVQVWGPDGQRTMVFSGIGDDAIITALAVAGENVFVADARSRTVMRFTPGGTLTLTINGKQGASDGMGFVIPSPFFDLVPGQGGTLWIVNPGRHRLEEYNFNGERIGLWSQHAGMGLEDFCGCCNPTHVARLGDGAIVTAEKGLSRVKVYTQRGGFVGVVAAPDRFDRHDLSLDLAVDSQDRILVADPARRQVRVFERK